MRDRARIMSALSGKPWAIQAEGLDELIALAKGESVTIEALGRKAAARSTDGRVAMEDDEDGPPARAALDDDEEYLREFGSAIVRDGVAIVPVFGPLIAYASWLEACGLTSYETIRKDLAAAVAHGGVTAVILEIDSPGGQVTGCSEAAAAIRAVAEIMPVVAVVVGDCCSAAYWLASPADHIAIAPTSGVGSLGCCCSIIDRRGAEEKAGIKTWEIISSQTPNKRPDVATDSGRAAIQKIADDTAAIFLAEVASNRGLSLEVVSSPQFGQGAVLIGQHAVDANLADEIASLEDVMAELAPEETEATEQVGSFL